MSTAPETDFAHARPVALVTGAASKFGSSLARHLHQQGYDILLHVNPSQEGGLHLAMALNTQRDHSAHVLQADLLELEQVRKLARDCLNHWGRLDVLINNAACFHPVTLAEVTENDWNDQMGSNARAPYFLVQELAGALDQSRGCIVNILDSFPCSAGKPYSLYAMSQAALQNMTRELARELAPRVRVNAVAAGTMQWPSGEGEQISEAEKKAVLDRICLHRLGEPGDIASAASFLVRQADYITGQVLHVDGGSSLPL